MKKTSIVALAFSVFVAGILGANDAWAGSRATPKNVVVHKNADGSGYAYGAQGDVRNSTDANENIGCLSWVVAGSTTPLFGCSAADQNSGSSQVSASCWV